jgi:hypothetical protein
MGLFLEARVSNYEKDICELAKKYCPGFEPFPAGRPDVVKYCYAVKSEGKFRLVIISQVIDNFKKEKYNVIVTVHGTDKNQVKNQIADLEKNLGIRLRDAPEIIKKQQELLANLLGF